MSIAFLPDLEASRDLLCGVQIMTAYHNFKITGVKDVNVEDEYIVVYTPQNMGDMSTTTTLLMADLVSVQLLPDVKYEMGRDQHQHPNC